MTTSSTPPSPTGRLSSSQPEMQYFPGTPQAQAQARRMKAALEKAHAEGTPPFIDLDFSSIELKEAAAYAQGATSPSEKP